ncbi:DUF308 domain-containing protein [Pseudofrankia sp. BMG5.37]|uniref:DUF308 domain-containing protein n=1 Tax=Pseudofrankia sp. BMG5.37 TaxID=3050035 RepID=UPI002893FAA3|nr:DUF308 domain-containing protein [Pseudofrankia sp. BMG5.37]MDT3445952.1 DUF308 domain-containing protein [Pseudofrankia sp. BMG5.37]
MADNPDPRPADGGADQPADDDVFAELVARFDDEPAEHTWPEAEDVTPGSGAAGEAGLPATSARTGGDAGDGDDDEPTGPTDAAPPASGLADGAGRWPGGRSGRDLLDDAVGRGLVDGSGWRRPGDTAPGAPAPGADDGDELDEDEHYLPPPPPKAGRVRPATGIAIGAIVLGVLILVIPTLVSQVTSGVGDITGVVLILGGVGGLVARLSERPPTDDDGPDNGAVL